MNAVTIGAEEHILIIAPHPDDECIGPGGVLCCFSTQCDVAVLTDGARGQGNLSAEEGRNIRRQEFQKEMAFLGIKNYCLLDIPDGMLMQHIDCLNDYPLEKYSKIFVTSPNDNHADHTAAYISLMNALRAQSILNKEIYLYEVHNALECPTHYLDITECMDEKKELIGFHFSQTGTIPYDRYAEVTAEYRALQNRKVKAYWEVYTCIKGIEEFDIKKSTLENDLQKFKIFYQTLTKWMLSDGSRKVVERLKTMGIHNCIIYGYAELGMILRKELSGSEIEILYIMDKKVVKDPKEELSVYYPKEGLKDADIIIVTAVYQYEEIKRELEYFGFKNVISLKEIVDNF